MSYSFAAANDPTQTEGMGIRRKLAQVRMRLACAEDLFNCATDDAMLDTSIYELKALQVYYSFLMRQLRMEQEGDSDPIEEVPLAPLDIQTLSEDDLPDEEGMVHTMG